jgi:dimethylaniline monooxygenase (N-oxide forming)
VSSKQLTAFSDLRPRNDDPDFLSASRYIQYLKEYATKFNLWPHIKLSTLVESVTRLPSGTHLVTYVPKATGEKLTWECDAIAVCSGLHVVPNIPHLSGIERVPVTMHSSEFKQRKQFGVDRTVLILGSGETGSDVSYLAVTAPTKRVIICHRSGFHFAPKARFFIVEPSFRVLLTSMSSET